MRSAGRAASWLLCVGLLALPTSVSAADDCPSARSGKDGFVVERSGSSVTEVFHVQDSIVRTVMRSGGSTLLETTQFQGLLQLERIDRGRRTTFRPKDNLASIFPIKAGQQSTAEFEVQGEGSATSATVVLKVLAKDTLFVGPCRYEVLKVERSESRNGRPPRLINVDYYAPELKLVVAKEYKEKDGRLNLIKFDRIYPIKR
jgi:hypothetical protein